MAEPNSLVAIIKSRISSYVMCSLLSLACNATSQSLLLEAAKPSDKNANGSS